MINLQNLKNKFLIDEDAELENIEHLIDRFSEFVKVDLGGHVVFKDKNLRSNLTIPEKILVVIAARFLASKLQEKLKGEVTISPTVDAGEITKFINVQKTVVAARLKELKDERKILSPRTGVFSIAPYNIDSIIIRLEEKNKEK
ncbi:MAG: phage head-tail connector protein [Nanoarchaeota archaeon]|mgnify:CR=1 FL=1